MHGLDVLRDLLVPVGVAIPVVALAHRFGIPAIIGFLLAGVATGPHGLALIASQESVAQVAELGAVLLLFTIGLELSLSKVLSLGRVLLQGGSLQVGGTLAAVAGIAVVRGVEPRQAVFYGALAALSSTAIVLKSYADRGELDAPHGRVMVPILLFQDLCVVPLMLLVPLLAGADTGESQGFGIVSGLLVVTALVAGGRFLVPRILDRLVLFKDRELFTLCIVFLGLGAAFLTSSFGLSLALGAFLAGLVVSESEYGLQALSDVLPFRDTFTGVFFTSIGMLLDLGFVSQNLTMVLGVTVAVVLLKAVIGAFVVLSLGRSPVTSILTGAGLAQVGEFSFVLASAGAPLGLFAARDYQLFLAASVLTMLATPAFIAFAHPFAEWFSRNLGRRGYLAPGEPRGKAESARDMSGHAIIVGYGLSGRHLQRVLGAAGIPHLVLEQNGGIVRAARNEGVPIIFGDGTRRDVLEHVGIAKARVIVFVISSQADERRGVAVAHELNPGIRNVVRTAYVRSIDDLMRLGATAVVVEEYEATIELFARVLEFYEIPTNTIHRELEAIRGEHYRMLRAEDRPPMALHALRHLGIHHALDLVELEQGSVAVGESPRSLEVRKETGAVVLAVVREGRAIYQRDPDFTFRPGDTVVLVGDPDSLERGSRLFRMIP